LFNDFTFGIVNNMEPWTNRNGVLLVFAKHGIGVWVGCRS